MSKYQAMPDAELLSEWETEMDFTNRKAILKAMKKKGLFPDTFIKQWEDDTGAYPSNQDPLFLQKLLAKREFAESQQPEWDPGNDPCGDVNTFEVTPVQRFAANLMSPRSPYMSALLYHGVGVGKTCAAIQIAEAWLGAYPKDQVFLVAPPTIQEGFYRTIFDPTKLSIGPGPSDPNTIIGCTGDSYLELTGTTFMKDAKSIERKVRSAIKQRYTIRGYVSFAKDVESLLENIDEDLEDEEREQEERRILSKKFSGKLLIIDEAHNVRDEMGVEDQDVTEEKKEAKKDDMKNGKYMTKWLRKVLKYAQGLKLVLLTATPMYNNYREIVSMLNLLLLNDKKAEITDDMIFRPSGRIHSEGMKELGAIASRYVSFMRGENPNSFPIRIYPESEGIPLLKDWTYPSLNPRGTEAIPEEELVFKDHLPIVTIELEGDSLEASLELTEALEEGEQGIGLQIGRIIQAGNFIPPAVSRSDTVAMRLGRDGLNNLFKKSKGSEITYTSKTKRGASWLARDTIGRYAPKFAFLLDQLASCKGVAFVYMRTVALGALPLALALEANGYTAANREMGLLGDGIQAEGGRQCAKCVRKEDTHGGAKHDFVPALYGFLSGDVELTPHNKATIDLERQKGNEEGALMKVIIGSQIAGEGVDLRYVREVHMLDSWYHLNRTEQVIGRAIRFCSHSALSKEKRNTTIYMYAAVFPEEQDRETGDLFSYRNAFRKAVQVGNVTRALKIHAIDCNLNHDAIIIANQEDITQVDSKGHERKDVDINDKPFTAICDWNDSCLYDCKPQVKISIPDADDSTYSEYAAKWRESELKQLFREAFAEQPFYAFEDLWDQRFGDIPIAARADLFSNIIDNKAFQVSHKGISGYIKFCNGYYVFQPNVYMDLHIPLAVRSAQFPVRRDHFEPERRILEESASVSASAPEAARFTLVETWNGIVEWADMLKEIEAGEEVPKDIPAVIHDRIQHISNRDSATILKYKYIMETIAWFHESVLETGGSRRVFRKVLLQFIWDNWFTMENQLELLTSDANKASDMVKDSEIHVSGYDVVRLYNAGNATIEYICKGSTCSAAISNVVKEEEEPIPGLFSRQKDPYGTGSYYGFLSSKDGQLVFRINPAFLPQTKIKLGGVECGLNSNIDQKHKILLKLGRVLEKAGLPDLDLRPDVILVGERLIENAVRGCTLLELVLRYMELSEVNGQRWFFRPVFARLIGYVGRFKRVKATSSKSKAKAKAVEEESSEEDTPKRKPSKKSAKTVVDSDEEEPPKKSSKKSAKTVLASSEEDEPPKKSSKKSAKTAVDSDEEEPPKKSSKKSAKTAIDSEDEEPPKKSKSKSAKAVVSSDDEPPPKSLKKTLRRSKRENE